MFNYNESDTHIGPAPLSPELVHACMERVKDLRLEGFLTGFGRWPGRLMMVGEAPGATEVQNGRPFSGQAGKVLDGYLEALEITRDDLYITSSVRSRPYKDKPVKGNPDRLSRSNRTPTRAEVLAFAPILDQEIAIVQPEILITLGNIGLQRLLGDGYTITAVHGQPIYSKIQQVDRDYPEKGYYWSDQEYCIFPMYHPAAVLYNRSLTDVIADDLKQLRELIGQKSQIVEHK
ncbi:uracil-DNA glycosylase [Paenibacillus bovis]|uniref:Uracil-DNA glycosylase n=1 Tax=Paenibacillus bovis TaxID=1616788 RepID=A0A172ZMS6_9BACL|nr:uracil-DNA glycosylase [Paenibacillus bovis]ANF98878.1 uracil-DNA glycosylase [Paenibacillus bovis]